MERSHQTMPQGDATTNIKGPTHPSLQASYFSPPLEFDRQVKNYLSRARGLLTLPDVDLTEANPELQSILTAASGELLSSLDKVVGQYQTESETEVANLKTLETAIVLLTLLILFQQSDRLPVPAVVFSARQLDPRLSAS